MFVIGTLCFSVMIALIKLAGQRLHVTQILFVRQAVMMLLAMPVIISGYPGSLRSARPLLQVGRIGVAFAAMMLGFTAVVHLPLAEATTISFSKTFFMTLLAIFLLGETVRAPRWTAVAIGFAGVLLIVWPDDLSRLDVYHLMALGSAMCVGFVMILVRMLSQVDRPVTILSFQAIGVGLLMLVPMMFHWQTPTVNEWLILGAIGAISAVGQTITIYALRAGEASAMAPLDYTRLVFTTLLGLWLFAEWPEPRVGLGALIIVGAALYTMHRERQAAQRNRAENI